MKSINVSKSARQSAITLRKVGTGLLMMGLALTASAKDGTREPIPAAGDQPTSVTPRLPLKKTRLKARRWFEVGIASWYGTHFQGRTTAAGERFDMNDMTCAHPTLPMGTWLRVTNLKNRRTTMVRVNDRGPVTEGRIVDLSYAAAQILGMGGLGQVRLETVPANPAKPAAFDRALISQLQIPLIPIPLAP
jgi:rare lipoprotein A